MEDRLSELDEEEIVSPQQDLLKKVLLEQNRKPRNQQAIAENKVDPNNIKIEPFEKGFKISGRPRAELQKIFQGIEGLGFKSIRGEPNALYLEPNERFKGHEARKLDKKLYELSQQLYKRNDAYYPRQDQLQFNHAPLYKHEHYNNYHTKQTGQYDNTSNVRPQYRSHFTNGYTPINRKNAATSSPIDTGTRTHSPIDVGKNNRYAKIDTGLNVSPSKIDVNTPKKRSSTTTKTTENTRMFSNIDIICFGAIVTSLILFVVGFGIDLIGLSIAAAVVGLVSAGVLAIPKSDNKQHTQKQEQKTMATDRVIHHYVGGEQRKVLYPAYVDVKEPKKSFCQKLDRPNRPNYIVSALESGKESHRESLAKEQMDQETVKSIQ